MQLTLLGWPQLHQATNEGALMRAFRIQFHPERIQISAEEILADLRYPAAKKSIGGERKSARRRTRRA